MAEKIDRMKNDYITMKTSVALCTYNGEKFLQKQLDSILNQTINVDEIVVCDDGSQDATVAILNTYKENFPGLFKIFINEENLRSVKNFEKALSLCENQIIFLCDQDDIWIPEKVEIILRHFQENPELKVIASNGYPIDQKGDLMDLLTVWDVISFLRERNFEIDYYRILNLCRNIATGATMAIHKEYLTNILPFPILPNYHHDEYIAMVGARENKFELIDDKTIYYRQHDNQQVGGVFYENTEARKINLISHYTPDFGNTSFANYKVILKRIAKTYLKNKDFYDKADQQLDFFNQNASYLRDLFLKVKREMIAQHPIRSFLINTIDKVTNKRQV